MDFIDRAKGIGLDAVDPNEELLDGAEDHRCFGPPTIGITVKMIVDGYQTSDLRKAMDHVFVCVEDVFSDPFRNSDFLGVASVVVYRREERKSVFQPDLIIFLAMPRRRVPNDTSF